MQKMMIGLEVYESPDSDRLLKADELNYMDPHIRGMLGRTARWALTCGHEMIVWRLKPGERVAHYDIREEVCQ